MRSLAEIEAEQAAFEAQFHPPFIPAGTPDRRRLQREADAEAHARACLPENIATRCRLSEERRAVIRSQKARAAAVKRAASPQYQERQRVFSELRKLGFKREHVSGKSAYYYRGCLAVRVSNHEVPLTDERQWNLDNGGRSWANSRWSLVLGEDDAETWLEELREYVEANG